MYVVIYVGLNITRLHTSVVDHDGFMILRCSYINLLTSFYCQFICIHVHAFVSVCVIVCVCVCVIVCVSVNCFHLFEALM